MRWRRDVAMAVMAMAPVHRVRVPCDYSRASTAPQGCAVLVCVRVRVNVDGVRASALILPSAGIITAVPVCAQWRAW
jgi:hypothetical protein